MFVVFLFIVQSTEFFFLTWQSELRGQHCARRIVLNTPRNSYLNQAAKKMYKYILLFAKLYR